MPLVGQHQTDHDTPRRPKRSKPSESPEAKLRERIKLTFQTLKACERARENAKATFQKAALDIAYYSQSVDRERRFLNELGRMLLAEESKPKESSEMDTLRKKFGE